LSHKMNAICGYGVLNQQSECICSPFYSESSNCTLLIGEVISSSEIIYNSLLTIGLVLYAISTPITLTYFFTQTGMVILFGVLEIVRIAIGYDVNVLYINYLILMLVEFFYIERFDVFNIVASCLFGACTVALIVVNNILTIDKNVHYIIASSLLIASTMRLFFVHKKINWVMNILIISTLIFAIASAALKDQDASELLYFTSSQLVVLIALTFVEPLEYE